MIQPVAEYWPAFGAAGKADITLAQALSHQAGLAAFVDPIDPALWFDWDGLCQRLAQQTPLWAPGTASGYHPQTYGFIAGEVLRRTTGRSVGGWLRTIGADVHCGLAASAQPRVGRMVKPPAPPVLGELTPLKRAAFLERWSSAASVDRTAWMTAEIPAANMHATSLGLAQMIQPFAIGQFPNGVAVGDAALTAAMAERITGQDLVLPFDLSWAAGVKRNTGEILGPSPTAIGHYGFGGACVIADPAHRLAFAFVPNKMSPDLVADPRVLTLIESVYAAL